MDFSKRVMVVAGLSIGAGAAALISSCSPGSRGTKPSGPAADLTKGFLDQLRPGRSGGYSLDVATQGVRQVTGDDGRARGAFDGTRLLSAADGHAYGTPAITDAARDRRGDGTATFNEVRHVVRHFDRNSSDGFDAEEARAFEREVGIRWIPAAG